jgi:hypothetical protein
VEVIGKLSVPITHKLPSSVIVRSAALLNMLYSPNELADELKVPARTIRERITKGLPYQRDRRGHLWVNGREFLKWVQTTRSVRPRCPLGSDEAFCLRCRRRVKLVNPIMSDRVTPPLLTGTCPHCGTTVNRGVKNDLSR